MSLKIVPDSKLSIESQFRLEVPGGGEMSRAESMYYTPDTTLEKLSEVANNEWYTDGAIELNLLWKVTDIIVEHACI